jgi:hypothetical protein
VPAADAGTRTPVQAGGPLTEVLKQALGPTDPGLMAMRASPDALREQRRLERERRRALRPEVLEAAVPLDAQPARSHGATRAALFRAGCRGVWLLAMAIAMLAGAILLARDDPRRYEALLQHGTETTGLVRSVHQNGSRSAVFFLRMRVDYFAAGARRNATVWLAANARRRHRGDTVRVVYRTERPAEATVVGEWNVVWWRRMAEWLLGIGAVIPLASALVLLIAGSRAWRALLWRPWDASPFHLHIGGRHTATCITLTEAVPDQRWRLLKVRAAPYRLNPLRSRPPRSIWFVADKSGRPIVVAAPGPGRLFPVRRRRPRPGRSKRTGPHGRRLAETKTDDP